MSRILLLEDDLSLVNGLSLALKKQGFELDVARTVEKAEAAWAETAWSEAAWAETAWTEAAWAESARTEASGAGAFGTGGVQGSKYDLLVLDVTLPDGSGFDFCQKVRKTSKVPIIFLTASDEEMNIVTGLDIGGDDYITKPFKLGVLISRIHALLRRAKDFGGTETELCSNGIKVMLLQGQAYKNGKLLDLTAGEYKLLCLLMQNPNTILSKEKILDKLWDCEGNYIDNNTLTVYIRRLRIKVEDDPGSPRMILTVRGMGYKWNEVLR